MPLKFKTNSSKRLNYLFIASPLPVAGHFKIIKQQRYSGAFGRLAVYIIGESHAVQIKNKFCALTEVLAYIGKHNLRSINGKKILLIPVKRSFSYRHENECLRYRIRIKKDKVTSRKIHRLLSEIKRYPGHKLFIAWPGNKSLPLPPSFTFISYAVRKNSSVKITTRHFYNNEFILVTSYSKITIKQQAVIK